MNVGERILTFTSISWTQNPNSSAEFGTYGLFFKLIDPFPGIVLPDIASIDPPILDASFEPSQVVENVVNFLGTGPGFGENELLNGTSNDWFLINVTTGSSYIPGGFTSFCAFALDDVNARFVAYVAEYDDTTKTFIADPAVYTTGVLVNEATNNQNPFYPDP